LTPDSPPASPPRIWGRNHYALPSRSAAPHVSVVIPVYNEEVILRASVLELREKLRPFGWSYELIRVQIGQDDDLTV